MASQTTALTVFSNYGDNRTYTTSGHTTSKPKLVIQKRKVPVGNQTVAETTISVVQATTDVASEILKDKVSMMATVRTPLAGASTDVDAVLAIFRDIIAGDEFANSVTTQEYLV